MYHLRHAKGERPSAPGSAARRWVKARRKEGGRSFAHDSPRDPIAAQFAACFADVG